MGKVSKAKRIIINLVLTGMVCTVMAQRPEERSLSALAYDSLITLFDKYSRDSLYARQIARVYIHKARLDNDSTKIARGYQRIAFVSPFREAVTYLDTTIAYSVGSRHPNFPASGYLFKAYYLYELEDYERSLQNALLGYRHARDKKNVRQQLTALHIIGGVNELWGDYQTALDTGFLTYELLFEYEEDIPDFSQNYLSSLETIGKCYVRLNKPDSALVYFKRAIDASLEEGDSISYYAFVSRSGTALYSRGDYRRALDSLFKADTIRAEYNNDYLPLFYYYVGSSFFEMGQQRKGIAYLERIDSIYQKRRVLTPELPSVYDRLIDYYRELGSVDKQLEYLRKQVKTLQLIDQKRILIKQQTNQSYVIPTLVAEKETQIAQLESKNRLSGLVLWASLALLAISSGLVAYYFRRQRLFKKRFETLMEKNGSTETIDESGQELDEVGISEDIIREVLHRLEKFETEQGYRDRSLTLNKLAKDFDSNSTYLSKIINVRKGKNFSRYLNDLRVDFAVRQLKEQRTFRRYTIKAIAQECGFKSAESFSKSFYRRHGIYPSYYIKKLQST